MLEFIKDLDTFVVTPKLRQVGRHFSVRVHLPDLLHEVRVLHLRTVNHVPVLVDVHDLFQVTDFVTLPSKLTESLRLHCKCLKQPIYTIDIIEKMFTLKAKYRLPWFLNSLFNIKIIALA